MIREDSLDEDRPCRDPAEWHRSDIDDNGEEYPFPHIRKGEISRFPFAVLEIKTNRREQINGPSNNVPGVPSGQHQWVTDLMQSHLVKEAPRFSKYAHGVSILFETYVNLLPFWLSEMDDDIRRDPQAVYQEEEEKRKHGKKVVWEPRQLLAATSITTSSGTSSKGKGPALEELPPVPEATPAEQEGASTVRHQRSILGLLSLGKSGMGTQRTQSPVRLPPGVLKPTSYLKNAGPVNVETKVWLANERTFIKWMHVVTLMATLALALYNGANSVGNQLASHLGAVYVFIAVVAAVWAYYSYMRRAHEIYNRSPMHMDDRIGPIVVGVALIVALSANFVFKVLRTFYGR